MRRLTCMTLLAVIAIAQADDGDRQAARLAALLGGDVDGFALALEPREFTFPEDHGPHPDFRNEWWYVTGNLDGEAGERFGFELTFFRFSLAPAIDPSDSAWRTNQVYIAHLALTDAQGETFYVAQRYSRGALGLAGARADPLRVWIDDWRLEEDAIGNWRLIADDAEFGIDVTVSAENPPTLNGIDGLSRKSEQAGNASYYYSITRLVAQGGIRVGESTYDVGGLAWLDREWSTSALADDQVGWDWFALQLSDGTDLMFYSLRLDDGSQDPNSAGTFVSSTGIATHLVRDDVEITVLDTWPSPRGGTYPSRWRLRVPRFGLDVLVAPVIADQELFTTVRYWEGAVDVTGTRNNTVVDGRGYVELTGYAN